MLAQALNRACELYAHIFNIIQILCLCLLQLPVIILVHDCIPKYDLKLLLQLPL